MGAAGGQAGGLQMAVGAPSGRALPRGTESQGLWYAGDGGLQEGWGTGIRD